MARDETIEAVYELPVSVPDTLTPAPQQVTTAELRNSYTAVDANARTLTLAEEWLAQEI